MLGWSVLDFIALPSCLVCGASLRSHKFRICPNCVPKTLGSENSCRVCGEPALSTKTRSIEPEAHQPLQETVCLPCHLKPLGLTSLSSVFAYDLRARDLIHNLKISGKFSLARPIAEILAIELGSLSCKAKPDYLVPIPSTSFETKRRGYWHMGLISKALSKLTGIPSSTRLFLNGGPVVEKQAYKSNQERGKKNYKVRESSLEGKTVLLLDDTITTGLSLDSAVQALKPTGVKSISALTLARSANFWRNRIDIINRQSLDCLI